METEPLAGPMLRPLRMRAVHALDAAVVVWVLAWIGIGIWVGIEVRGLATLSDTVATAGAGLQRTADAIETVSGIPLVGGNLGDVAGSIRAAGESAARSGPESRDHIERLSILLGVAIALVPSIPVLALYIPARVNRAREVRAITEALRASGPDAVLTQFLARRAADRLPYHVLREGAHDPWDELASGRYDRLAALELKRLGIARRPARDPSAREGR